MSTAVEETRDAVHATNSDSERSEDLEVKPMRCTTQCAECTVVSTIMLFICDHRSYFDRNAARSSTRGRVVHAVVTSAPSPSESRKSYARSHSAP